ncbi:MAG: protein translocase subunit SecF, partial [Clostridia bacterium]|nr:protein translocase subunit SecF [Clostridia bacterium]
KRKPENADVNRDDLAAASVRECLGRTINTTLTTLVTIVALYVLGVDAIREFSLPIIIGILAGVYSANLINGYVWAMLEGLLKNASKKAKNA